MPIFEFKCMDCDECFELLVMTSDERVEMHCPKCRSANFEKIMSCGSFNVGGGSEGKTGASSQTRNCSSGSCTTYTIPGPNG